MSHNIYDEQKIFAYRKLIDLLQNRFVRFYGNKFIDNQIYGELGLYEKHPISILLGLFDFLTDDAEDSEKFVSVTLEVKGNAVLQTGISSLTDYYVNSTNQVEVLPYPAHLDSNLTISEDYPDIVLLQNTCNEEFIREYLSLLLSIYALERPEAHSIVYSAGISIVIRKEAMFSKILKNGAFIWNLKNLIHPINRSNFGSYGQNLLSFGKQMEQVKKLIFRKSKEFEQSDILIVPQANPNQRVTTGSNDDYISSSKFRLLDCLFYLEYIQEIEIKELVPSRIVIDATKLIQNQSYYEPTESLLLCGRLQINEKKCALIWDGVVYKDIQIGKKSIKMLIHLLKNAEVLISYKQLINAAGIIAPKHEEPQVAQQYKNQLTKDLASEGIPKEATREIQRMIKSIASEGYRMSSH